MASRNNHVDRRSVPKKMRLGTRSCAECRRRKVRCIFSPNSTICQECVTHDSQCISQAQAQAQQHRPPPAKGTQELQERLQTLEAFVSQICKSINLDIRTSSLADFELGAAQALQKLRPPTPGSSEDRDSAVGSIKSESFSTPSVSQTESIDDAPLLSLFRDAMVIQTGDAQSGTEWRDTFNTQRVQNCMASLNALVPLDGDLFLILGVTEPYWALWKLFPTYILALPAQEKLTAAKNFLRASLELSSPVATFTRAVLGLALCIQQLPKYFEDQLLHLPAPLYVLFNTYMDGAESLLSFLEGSGVSMQGLECFILQAKLFLDDGKPKQTLLTNRRAMNLAMLLGLHNPAKATDEERKAVWADMWLTDCMLSLNLGLPAATTTSHPGLSPELIGPSLQAKLKYQLGVISIQIIERNQTMGREDAFFQTLKIHQLLEDFGTGLGSQFLQLVLPINAPAEEFYGSGVAKMYFHTLCKFAYLPYIFDSSDEFNFKEIAIEGALKASRNLLGAYQGLRGGDAPLLFMCDLMDFQAFQAAITMILILLAAPASRQLTQQDFMDWELISGVSKTLRRVSAALECGVAGQAAQTLEYISIAHNGEYDYPEPYEVYVPYFGKIRISQIKRPPPIQTLSTPESLLAPPADFTDVFANTIEFNLNSPMPLIMAGMEEFPPEEDIGIDWSLGLDGDCTYDWSHVFSFTGGT